MNCSTIEDKILDYLEDNLSEAENLAVAHHLKNCINCSRILEQSRSILRISESINFQKPSPGLSQSFEQLLQEEMDRKPVTTSKLVYFSWKQALRVAAMLVLVVGSYWIGNKRADQSAGTRISHMEDQLQELKTEMTLAMFNNPSASKRIQAVNYSEELQRPEKKVIEAIIIRFQNDDNVNVRMAAAEALWKFREEELVKQALIKSLETEKNPDVQILVIQFLSEAQEKWAVQPMKKLLVQPDLEPYVKDQLSNGLKRIL